MKRTLSVEEIKVLIIRYMEGNELTIQQRSKESPSFSFNLKVSNCVSTYNGLQFHVNGGYINWEFPDDLSIENGYTSQQKHELEFVYDDDKPKGYWLHVGESSLFFYGKNIEEILERLKAEVEIQRKKEEIEDQARQNADRYIPKEVWDSIDNMMEK